MNSILKLIFLLFISQEINAQELNLNNLWKVINKLPEGSVIQLDNQYAYLSNDTVFFSKSNEIVAKGVVKNDTIFLHTGFEEYSIEWIHQISDNSMISSIPKNGNSDGLEFEQIDLSGKWRQLNYHWDGNLDSVEYEITQIKDTIYFYQLSIYVAKALIKRDSIILIQGLEVYGVDFFELMSNNYFLKIRPSLESIDLIEFIRLVNPVDVFSLKRNENSIQIFPVPSDNFIRILSKENLIDEVRIFSNNGQLIKYQRITEYSYDLNISNFEKGVYVLEISFKNEKRKLRIIKI